MLYATKTGYGSYGPVNERGAKVFDITYDPETGKNQKYLLNKCRGNKLLSFFVIPKWKGQILFK